MMRRFFMVVNRTPFVVQRQEAVGWRRMCWYSSVDKGEKSRVGVEGAAKAVNWEEMAARAHYEGNKAAQAGRKDDARHLLYTSLKEYMLKGGLDDDDDDDVY
jgi:hypothetical protein